MSKDLMIVRTEALLVNPAPRIAIVLCLDASGSMDGEPMRELNEGVRLFFNTLREDPITKASAEVGVVAFSDEAEVVLDFQGLDSVISAPELTSTGGLTNLGAGVDLSLDLLDTRKKEYQRAGVDYFQPWLVLMTDGAPTTNVHRKSGPRTCKLEEDRKLTVFPIGIGHADMSVLAMFSDKSQPLKLQGLNFQKFFQWLSQSVVRVSQSRPGEKTSLDLDGIKGWAEL